MVFGWGVCVCLCVERNGWVGEPIGTDDMSEGVSGWIEEHLITAGH